MSASDDENAIDELALKMSERHAESIPSERKFQIALELIQKTTRAGAQSKSMSDCLDYLDGPELELLLAIMGKRLPISDDEFSDPLALLVLARGK